MRYDASDPEHNRRVAKILLDGLPLYLMDVMFVDPEAGEVEVVNRGPDFFLYRARGHPGLAHRTLRGRVHVTLRN